VTENFTIRIIYYGLTAALYKHLSKVFYFKLNMTIITQAKLVLHYINLHRLKVFIENVFLLTSTDFPTNVDN